MRSLLFPLAFGLFFSAAEARATEPCAAPLTPAAMAKASDAARASFEGVRIPDFKAALDGLDGELRCLNGAPEAHTLASWYRLKGLRAFLDKDSEGAKGWFAAANALDPSVATAPALPTGHPALALWAEGVKRPLGEEAVPPPAEGALLWDGRAGLSRPTGRPTLFQQQDAAGAVSGTRVLQAGDPVPEYPVAAVASAPEVPPPSVETPTEPHRGRAVRIGLLAGAGGLAAVAITGGVLAGTTGAAYAEHLDSEILNPEESDIDAFLTQAERLRGSHNTWVGVAGAAGAAALGAATLGLVVQW